MSTRQKLLNILKDEAAVDLLEKYSYQGAKRNLFKKELASKYPGIDPDLVANELSLQTTKVDRAKTLADMLDQYKKNTPQEPESLRGKLRNYWDEFDSPKAATVAGGAAAAGLLTSDTQGPIPEEEKKSMERPEEEEEKIPTLPTDEGKTRAEPIADNEDIDETDRTVSSAAEQTPRLGLSKKNPYDEQISILESKAKAFGSSEDLTKEEEAALAEWKARSADLKKAYNEAKERIGSVSYTHLTLPTIYSV